MPDAFKNNFNQAVIQHLGDHLAYHSNVQNTKTESTFDLNRFLGLALKDLDKLELKERSNQIVEALYACMPHDLSEVNRLILASLATVGDDETIVFENTNKGPVDAANSGIAGWIMMPVSDYVTKVTLAEIKDLSSQSEKARFAMGLALLKECTKRFSAEFAIRPFLRDYPMQTLSVLKRWASDDNVHVRRLASEGSRPLLPWGLRLGVFVDDPDKIIPLLKSLRDDESEYVRRSVANSLNDIAKHHPERVAELCTSWWQDDNKTRCKLLKHACRTLLKNGHSGALALFGYPPAELSSVSLSLDVTSLSIGDDLNLFLEVSVDAKVSQKLLIDYVVHHQKANGKMSPKVFKWTSIELPNTAKHTITKKHSFKPVTTRKYYCGEHKIEILINGKVVEQKTFYLA